jgi:hypothetical protein
MLYNSRSGGDNGLCEIERADRVYSAWRAGASISGRHQLISIFRWNLSGFIYTFFTPIKTLLRPVR